MSDHGCYANKVECLNPSHRLVNGKWEYVNYKNNGAKLECRFCHVPMCENCANKKRIFGFETVHLCDYCLDGYERCMENYPETFLLINGWNNETLFNEIISASSGDDYDGSFTDGGEFEFRYMVEVFKMKVFKG